MAPRKKTTKRTDQLHAPLTVSWLWRVGGIIGALISGAYVVWTAWTGFGWWVPASVTLVDDHIARIVTPIASKVDDQGVSILSGRVETLRGAKQLQVDAKGRLELQSHTTKDPIAQQIIQGQRQSIDETIKGIDDQIVKLTAQLQQMKK